MCRNLIFMYSVLILAVTATNAARILAVCPTPSLSHQVVFRVLTLELARRGHQVVSITTDPAFLKGEEPANLTEIDMHDISYEYQHKIIVDALNAKVEVGKKSKWTSEFRFLKSLSELVEIQIKTEEVQTLIREKKRFDLVLIETFIRPTLVYSYIFKAPVIIVSSFGALLENLETVGASTHPAFYPIPFRRRLYNLTLWEKMKDYYYHLELMYYQKYIVEVDNRVLQRIAGKNVPSITELENNVHMLFLNVHPIWMDNQPMPPNVVFMGGLHQKPKKDLPQELQSYLDSSKNGVIYVSFGSNIQPIMFPPEGLKVLTETLSELPYDVLFKWSDDELPGKPENVKILKWLPQSDLLRHPNVRAFVMQGGLQSTDEAITAGVPLVCIPMFGDQWYNAEKYVKLKIGLQIELETLTKSQLKEAIETVITNKSYRENIVRLRERMHDQPQTPLERVIWWIEYVLRHGGARHLRAPTANISWTQYYELELVLVVLTILTTFLLIVLYFIKSLWYFISPQFIGSKSKIKRS